MMHAKANQQLTPSVTILLSRLSPIAAHITKTSSNKKITPQIENAQLSRRESRGVRLELQV